MTRLWVTAHQVLSFDKDAPRQLCLIQCGDRKGPCPSEIGGLGASLSLQLYSQPWAFADPSGNRDKIEKNVGHPLQFEFQIKKMNNTLG